MIPEFFITCKYTKMTLEIPENRPGTLSRCAGSRILIHYIISIVSTMFGDVVLLKMNVNKGNHV